MKMKWFSAILVLSVFVALSLSVAFGLAQASPVSHARDFT